MGIDNLKPLTVDQLRREEDRMRRLEKLSARFWPGSKVPQWIYKEILKLESKIDEPSDNPTS